MNSISLKKSGVALALLIAMASVGFNSAYGYGGGSGTRTKVTLCQNGNTITVAKPAVAALLRQGATEGACVTSPAPTPAPLVLGASTQGNVNQQYQPILTTISSLLKGVQAGNEKGEISDDDTSKLVSQLASVFSAIKGLFR